MVKRRLKSVADLKIVVIGDEQTVCGLVLAGAGAVDGQGRKSFFVVDANTRAADTAAYFQEVIKRPDTGIVLITQTAANSGPAIRSALDEFSKAGAACPAVLEIPSKDSEYDAKKDPIMQRVQMFFGSNPVMDMEFAELEEGVWIWVMDMEFAELEEGAWVQQGAWTVWGSNVVMEMKEKA